MGLELYMVGVVVSDMARALEFYRRLGVEIPDESDELEHVEVKMSGLTFFITTEAVSYTHLTLPTTPYV